MLRRTLLRYVLLETSRVAAVTLSWLLLLGVVVVLVRAQFTAVGRALGTREVLGVVPWLLPYLLCLLLPLAVLAAAVTTFGRLSAENELLAMEASGVRLGSALLAPALVGLAGSVLVLWLHVEGFSYAAASLSRREMQSRVGVAQLAQPGATLDLAGSEGRWRLTFGPRGPGGERPVTAVFLARGEGGLELSARDFDCRIRTVEGASGRPRRLADFTFRDVQVVRDPYQPYTQGSFRSYALPGLELPDRFSRSLLTGGPMRASLPDNLARLAAGRARAEALAKSYRRELRAARARLALAAAGAVPGKAVLALGRLNHVRDELEELCGDLRDLRAEVSRKLAFSVSPLVLAVLGAALGALTRKASKLIGLSLGVAVAAFYYGAWVLVRAISDSGFPPPWASPWVPNLLAAAGTWWLVRRREG